MRLHPLASLLPFLVGSSFAAPQFNFNALDARSTPQESADSIVLAPAVHWTVDNQDLGHVVTSNRLALYYSQDGSANPTVEHTFGSTIMTYSLPAVNLDHVGSAALVLGKGQAIVKFDDSAAYETASQSWPSDSQILLLTYQPVCKAYYANEYCYLLASNYAFDQNTLSVTLDAHLVSPDDYFTGVDFEWGLYKPDESSPALLHRRDSATTTAAAPACMTSEANGLAYVTLGPDFDYRLDKCAGFEEARKFDWYDYAVSVGADQETESEVAEIPNDRGDGELYHSAIAESIANQKASKVAASETMTGNEGGATGAPATNSASQPTHSAAESGGQGSSPSNTAAAESGASGSATNAAPTSSSTASSHKRDIVDLEKRIRWLRWIPIDIPGVNVPLTKDFDKQFSFNLPENQGNDDSPFGKARLLKSYTGQKTSGNAQADGTIKLWCVDCGAQGSIDIYGKGTFEADASPPLQYGVVTATANLNIGFQLGMEINATISDHESQQLGSFGLPGLSYGVITIGPQVTVGADFNFLANAYGKLLAGARYVLQNAKSTLDFVHPENSGSSGWTPQFVPIFEASGEISISAEVGLPISLSVGINIANGKYVKSVGVVDRPALIGAAEFAASADTSGVKVTVTDGCEGISTQISFKNELYADILGTHYNIMSPYNKVLDKGCIKVGDQNDLGRAAPLMAALESETHRGFTGYNTTGDGRTDYTELVDATSKYFLTSCPDGNTYMQNRTDQTHMANLTCTRVFESHDSSVVGDGFSRLFSYSADVMDVYGVSRLRLHKSTKVPKGSTFVNFNEYSNATNSVLDKDENNDGSHNDNFQVARNQAGDLFYLALCAYKDPATNPQKIFLMKDAEQGLTTLESEDAQRSVTGGAVEQCYLIPVQIPEHEHGDDWNDYRNVNEGYEGATGGEEIANDENW